MTLREAHCTQGGLYKESPRVSIVIPTFNNALFMREALESIFAQTYGSYEVIVVDDGSTDDTRSVLEPYRNRIHYRYQEHAGVSTARNRGLTASKGDYVVFLDGDDRLLPTKLFEQVAYLDTYPTIGYVHSGWQIIDRHGNLKATVEPWHRASKLDLESLLRAHPFFLGAIMIRRNWMEKAGEFNRTLPQAEDVEYFLRLGTMGCSAAWLKKSTVLHRQHEESLTTNVSQRVACVNRVFADFFRQPDLPRAVRELERTVRYNILMWGVWKLYRAGDHEHISEYLCQARFFMEGHSRQIVQKWFHHFVRECRGETAQKIEEIRGLLPYFKAAVHIDDVRWAPLERFLNWLIESEEQIRVKAAGDTGETADMSDS